MNTKTLIPKQDRQIQKWYLVVAEGKILGRLASRIATMLRGKDNPLFTPHLDMGVFVVVINADKVALSGMKLSQKTYYWYTGYPGGFRKTTPDAIFEKHPERVLEKAVRGMLPHNRLGDRLRRKLFVYAGAEHPHKAQKPEKIDIR